MITDVTSEMFLCIMILLQTKLPCSTNFYRYQKNYEQFLGQDKSADTKSTTGEGEIKLIASPKMMSKLSPVNAFAKEQGINFNPDSQKVLLQMASKGGKDAAGDEKETVTVSNFKSNRGGIAERKKN